MDQKKIIFSTISFGLLLITFAGCDWCSCCKKSPATAEAKTVAPKTSEPETPVKPEEPTTSPMIKHPEVAKSTMPMPHPEEPMPKHLEFPEPKMIPHPVEPKMEMSHPVESKMPVEPKMPIEPKVAPMPVAPKTA